MGLDPCRPVISLPELVASLLLLVSLYAPPSAEDLA